MVGCASSNTGNYKVKLITTLSQVNLQDTATKIYPWTLEHYLKWWCESFSKSNLLSPGKMFIWNFIYIVSQAHHWTLMKAIIQWQCSMDSHCRLTPLQIKKGIKERKTLKSSGRMFRSVFRAGMLTMNIEQLMKINIRNKPKNKVYFIHWTFPILHYLAGSKIQKQCRRNTLPTPLWPNCLAYSIFQ